MKDFHAIAETFVADFVDRHTKTRILDGRPDRVLIKTLTQEIGQLLEQQFAAQTKKKGVAA
jgi:hypothetical protein